MYLRSALKNIRCMAIQKTASSVNTGSVMFYLLAPQITPFVQGVIELTIQNDTSDWHEITKAVFDSYLMKIFYNNEMVSMKGEMKISDTGMAETG